VGDPWDARSLEWSVASPPPEWNFATIPQVAGRDAFYARKRHGGAYKPADHYRDIEMPKESACGVIVGVAAGVCGFGLVWHIWWMAALFLTVTIATVIARSFMRDVTRIIPAATVEAIDRRWLAQAGTARAIPRQLEQTARNEGLVEWTAFRESRVATPGSI
jgi:cytochrome o ubiquinol oxidase subunit 1